MLFAALEQEVYAWERLRAPDAGELTTEQVLALHRLAGYGEETAQQAAKARALERLRRELPP